MNITDLFQGPMKDIIVGQISQQMGVQNPQQANTAVDGIMGMLLNAVTNNAATPEGQQNLEKALDRDHDGSILDHLGDFLNGSFTPSNPKTANGAGILNHLFKGEQENAAASISKTSGIDVSKIMSMMATLAPVLLGMLGKAKQQPQQTQAQQSGGGILDLLMGATKSVNQQPSVQNVLTSILTGNKQGGGLKDQLINSALQSVMKGFFK